MRRLFKSAVCVSLKTIRSRLKDKPSNGIPSCEHGSLSLLLTFFPLERLRLQMWGEIFQLWCLSDKKKSSSSLSRDQVYHILGDISCSILVNLFISWLTVLQYPPTVDYNCLINCLRPCPVYVCKGYRVSELKLFWSSLKAALNTDAVGFFQITRCLLMTFW